MALVDQWYTQNLNSMELLKNLDIQKCVWSWSLSSSAEVFNFVVQNAQLLHKLHQAEATRRAQMPQKRGL